METYMKRFVFAALIYLGLAAVCGVLNGTTDLGYWVSFAHTHFNLLGFMSMMVFGIGYFILPRFNGADLRFEGWVKPHFWLANISLVGMVVFRGLEVETGEGVYSGLFIASAAIQTTTIFMFIVNIWLTLSSLPETVESSAPAPSTVPPTPVEPQSTPTGVTGDSKIADLIDAHPSVMNVLVEAGLGSLATEGHLDKVRMMGITLGMAAGNHGIDQSTLVELVEKEINDTQPAGPTPTMVATQSSATQPSKSGNEITLDLLIGKVLEDYPEVRPVFQKYFGDGCFDCPGQSYESIDLACRMHNVDPSTFLEELKAAL